MTSSIGIAARVDQNPTTGTNCIATTVVGIDELGGGVGVGPMVGDPEGVDVGTLTVALGPGVALVAGPTVGAVGSFDESTGLGIAIDPPGAAVGGVDDPHEAKMKDATTNMTSRLLTDRAMAMDLTEKRSAR